MPNSQAKSPVARKRKTTAPAARNSLRPGGPQQLWLFQSQDVMPSVRRRGSSAKATPKKGAASSGAARSRASRSKASRAKAGTSQRKAAAPNMRSRAANARSKSPRDTSPRPASPLVAGHALRRVVENIGIAAIVGAFVFIACFAT